MTAGHNDRRLVKIRRRGRHSTPSQVERVAVQAGRAAPAVAIAGALVAVPGAQSAFAAQDTPATVTQTHEAGQADRAAHAGTESATLDSISTRSVTVASTGNARHAAQVRSSHYTVRSGDSLSKIAEHFYDKAADWGYLYHENAKTVSNPNLIFAGENLYIPANVPADYKLADYYTPKHAAPAGPGRHGNGLGQQRAAAPAAPTTAPAAAAPSSCSRPARAAAAAPPAG